MTIEELSKLDYDGARGMLLAYTTDLKRCDQDLATLEKELGLWTSRVSLAESRGLAELAEAAREQLTSLQERKVALEGSRSELVAELARLKEALPAIKARERSVDVDRLQAELDMLTGKALEPEKAELNEKLSALEQDDGESALQALKRKMGL